MQDDLKTNSVQPQGLYEKYLVTRRDGRDEPGGDRAGASYFVLDLDHDKFAVPALRAYADACEREYPILAQDIRRMIEGK
ncbi:hypothetical protein PJWF_00052 [Achromobacter phage JWF]|uniref:sulfatase-modifying factor enzyme n=1 Tax=Achromobacter phage JWF TaxID=1589748 RepID=UPI000588E47A|nr:sulfatase-modifying factor enzyme [Achromobacter phage JWF]AJD82946.1 hypothetical protein PJWF_00052 [Achromobacter phage JWF]